MQPSVAAKVRTLWTGVGATLLKDVPFAGLYWSLLEPFKRILQSAEGINASGHSRVSLLCANPNFLKGQTEGASLETYQNGESRCFSEVLGG